MTNSKSFLIGTALGTSLAILPATATAQTPEPEPEAAPAAAAPAEAAPAKAADAAPPPPPPEKPPPEPPAPEFPSAHLGVWLRLDSKVHGTSDPQKLDHVGVGIYADALMSGRVHELVGYTLNVNMNGLAAQVQIEDAIVSFDFIDQFHLWVGQLLVPGDRTNFSGPYFIIPWNYPGVYSVGAAFAFVNPIEPIYGRDAGGVIWGDIGKQGKFKYFFGVFNLSHPDEHPLWAGRLSSAIIGDDPGFWGGSTFYGAKDILAVGVGAQYEAGASVEFDDMGVPTGNVDDFSEINADVLAEFNVGPGTITGEAAYYHYSGDYNADLVLHNGPNPATDSFFALVGFLTPPLGPGRLHPMARFQYAHGDNTNMWMLDGSVAYVLKGPALRVVGTYQRTDMGNNIAGNALLVGVQTMAF
jgi:prepilin-type processing-associated H-X9-DG protein